jgi:hypothetical protein
MHTGMLWFDNSSAALSVKIQKAAEYYEKKYGRRPDLCLVHPSLIVAADSDTLKTLPLSVRPYKAVVVGHIWIGIEEKQ